MSTEKTTNYGECYEWTCDNPVRIQEGNSPLCTSCHPKLHNTLPFPVQGEHIKLKYLYSKTRVIPVYLQKAKKVLNLIDLLVENPENILDQLEEKKTECKQLHLAIAAEQELRDVCIYLKEFVSDSFCSDSAKEYLATLDGYSLKLNQDGAKIWYLHGEYHRENGPAVVCHNGTKKWWLNGKRHRENGPAYEDGSGYKAWFVNGKRHRENGPAREWANGAKEWWLNGQKVTEQDVMGTPLCRDLQVLIEQHGKEQVYIALSKL